MSEPQFDIKVVEALSDESYDHPDQAILQYTQEGWLLFYGWEYPDGPLDYLIGGRADDVESALRDAREHLAREPFGD